MTSIRIEERITWFLLFLALSNDLVSQMVLCPYAIRPSDLIYVM